MVRHQTAPTDILFDLFCSFQQKPEIASTSTRERHHLTSYAPPVIHEKASSREQQQRHQTTSIVQRTRPQSEYCSVQIEDSSLLARMLATSSPKGGRLIPIVHSPFPFRNESNCKKKSSPESSFVVVEALLVSSPFAARQKVISLPLFMFQFDFECHVMSPSLLGLLRLRSGLV
ncbi:hypothetical protein KY290_017048 [Solanum tuberosum]|uniref:Uncharacterized protein n=1 Tax=Solanum tuberosum TaxID=4113 RepID=A0ABQ7VD76_SOLTU|nr:hypothetical protein KY284_016115 [Solanum tuberosum]KAH0701829.1 hypothetical protein KY285_016107 [Solanum tuberosum]KAH0760975.1 hypothetical protein KY290_017048 [Solanum tuberosum]